MQVNMWTCAYSLEAQSLTLNTKDESEYADLCFQLCDNVPLKACAKLR